MLVRPHFLEQSQFSFEYEDGRDEATLTFVWRGDRMYLSSFQAAGVFREWESLSRGSVSTMEYRIPQYSFDFNIPVKMTGLHSAAEQEWDRMIASLSAADQAVWDRIKADRGKWPEFSDTRFTAYAAAHGLPVTSEKLPPEREKEADKLVERFADDELHGWIDLSEFSAAAKARIHDHCRKWMLLRKRSDAWMAAWGFFPPAAFSTPSEDKRHR